MSWAAGDGAGRPAFPAHTRFQLGFEPGIPFGENVGRSRTTFGPPDFQPDLFTGKTGVVSPQVPAPLDTDVHWANATAHFDGANATVEMWIPSEEALRSVLASLYFHLPVVLGIRLRDPLWLSRMSFVVDEVEYPLKVRRSVAIRVNETDLDTQAELVAVAAADLDALHRLESTQVIAPLAASMGYFMTAQRLSDVGVLAREFFPEVLLNYAKALEALWGANRDDIRTGLLDLGIPEEQVESVFIPVCLLRNALDVGHACIDTPRRDLLERLYEHIEGLDAFFFAMFERLLQSVGEGRTPYRVTAGVPTNETELEKILASLDREPPVSALGRPFQFFRVNSRRAEDDQPARGWEDWGSVEQTHRADGESDTIK
jgi:hypothetical protein